MRTSRSIIMAVILIIVTGSVLISINNSADGYVAAQSNYLNDSSELKLMLYAAQHTTSWDARETERSKFSLPVLYLHQGKENTSEVERTLAFSFTGLQGGKALELEMVSQHADITTRQQYMQRQQVVLPDRDCILENPCVVRWVLNLQTTPSDFYILRVRDETGAILWQNPYADRPDFVLLDRWDMDMDAYKVSIIYATLFPFARGQNDQDNQLAPDEVTEFIGQQFASIVRETWHTQFHVWGLGNQMHPKWDTDNIIEIVIIDGPYALFDNIGTVSQFIDVNQEPTKESRIWWSSSNNSFQAYRTLEDAVRAVFAHEFFHLVQRNILLFTESPAQRWMKVFIEAQGKFAPSVQYPNMEIRRYGVQPHLQSEYLDSANRFIMQRLNSSYREMEADSIYKFDAVLYWRFLFERYGDMEIVRSALIEMTKGYNIDIVSRIGTVMQNTFAQIDGPFETFEDSLIAFARAIYALRLCDGRCEKKDFTQCGGKYYDPSGLYAIPPLEAELDYEGSHLTYEGAIPSSFGMDFIEINVDDSVNVDSTKVTLEGVSDVAQFNVQLWPIAHDIPHDYVLTPDPIDMVQDENGVTSYILENQFEEQDLILALIITRLDTEESVDPAGMYTVTVDKASR